MELGRHTSIIGDEDLRALGCGLTGAHRTGKSTIAKTLADQMKVPFLASSGSQVAKDMGIKVDGGMPIMKRLEFQEQVLTVFEAEYAKQHGMFVTDRTPLDFAAYTLADWIPGSTGDAIETWVMDYITRCFEVTNRYFIVLGIVQPGIKYVQEDGKPTPSTLYQEVLNTSIIGMAWDDRIGSSVTMVPRELLDNQARAEHVAVAYASQLKEYRSLLGNNLTLH